MNNDTNSGSNAHYKPPFKFGLGGVPLGNEFAVVTDKDAYAILESAWSVLLPGFRGALSGHMSARMTRQYTHISTQAARRAVDLLNQPQFVGDYVGSTESTETSDAKFLN